MEKIVLKVIACCVISFCLSISFIFIAIAQEEKGVSSENSTSENEVVIHSPIINLESSETADKDKGKKDKVLDDDSVSSDDPNADNYDELVKYLEKEKDYLKKLDEKFKALDEDIKNNDETGESRDKNKKDTKSLHENKKNETETNQISQLGENREGIDNGEERIVEDEDVSNDFADDDNINYTNPFDTAEVIYEMGKYKDALKVYKSLQKDTPNVRDFVWSQFQIANCYRNLKEFDKAAKEYQNFINKYPDSFWSEQALWYIADTKWWKEWNNRLGVNKESLELKEN